MQPVGDGVAPRLRLNSYLAGDTSTERIVKLAGSFFCVANNQTGNDILFTRPKFTVILVIGGTRSWCP